MRRAQDIFDLVRLLKCLGYKIAVLSVAPSVRTPRPVAP